MSALDPTAATRLRRLGGDRLLREMIELFLQLGPERMAGAGGENGDVGLAERSAHSLKSAAGNLGAVGLQQAAAAAELAAAQQDAAALREAALCLRVEYEAAVAELRQMLTELER